MELDSTIVIYVGVLEFLGFYKKLEIGDSVVKVNGQQHCTLFRDSLRWTFNINEKDCDQFAF